MVAVYVTMVPVRTVVFVFFFISSVHPWMRHMTINLQCISAFTAAELLSIAFHGCVQDFS